MELPRATKVMAVTVSTTGVVQIWPGGMRRAFDWGASTHESDPADVPVGSASPRQEKRRHTTQDLGRPRPQRPVFHLRSASEEQPPQAKGWGGQSNLQMETSIWACQKQKLQLCNLPGGAPSLQQRTLPVHLGGASQVPLAG